MSFLTTIVGFYREGGIFMHAVLAIAVVITAIVVERAIVIGAAAATNARKLTDDLVRTAAGGNLMAARNQVSGSKAPVARVAQAMLQIGHAPEETLQMAADDAATLVLPDLTRRLSYLSVLANSATLIGLLGTITGLITAISGVGVADASQRSAALSSGIAEALHTTAFGLVIAIPTLMIQGWLNGRVEGIADQCDQMSIRLSKALSAGGARATVTPIKHESARAAAN
jgi:biopolymer transport protein ExbB/TolQ